MAVIVTKAVRFENRLKRGWRNTDPLFGEAGGAMSIDTLEYGRLVWFLWVPALAILWTMIYVTGRNYSPRGGEWLVFLCSRKCREKLKLRKKHLQQLRLHGLPAPRDSVQKVKRDPALEPLILKGRFKEAKAYTMGRIRHHMKFRKDHDEARMYVRYLDLIEEVD
jgi:hypothetical protein